MENVELGFSLVDSREKRARSLYVHTGGNLVREAGRNQHLDFDRVNTLTC